MASAAERSGSDRELLLRAQAGDAEAFRVTPEPREAARRAAEREPRRSDVDVRRRHGLSGGWLEATCGKGEGVIEADAFSGNLVVKKK
jgi:hypothetical protein